MLRNFINYLSKLFKNKNNDKQLIKDIEKKEFPEDIILKRKWGELKGKKSAPLSNRQQKFVIEYLKDYDIKEAAIRAGYSEKTATANGTTLLSLAKINRAIKKERNQLSKK